MVKMVNFINICHNKKKTCVHEKQQDHEAVNLILRNYSVLPLFVCWQVEAEEQLNINIIYLSYVP